MKNKWHNYIYVAEYKWLVFLALICLCASAYLGYLTPIAISDLYNSYSVDSKFNDSFSFLILLFAFEYANRIIYQLSIAKYIQKLVQKVRSYCYRNWLLSYESIETGKNNKDRYPLGEVLARIVSDSESVRELVSMGGLGIFIDIIFIVSCLISFIKLNTISGVFLIFAELFACFFLLWGSRYIARVFMQVRVSTGMLSRTLADITASTRQIYYTPSYSYELNKAEGSFDDFLNKQLKANVWDASYYSIAESLFPILIALMVVIFPYSQIVELATLAAIIDLIQRSIGPIKDVTAKIANIQRARTGFMRMNEFNSDLTSSPSSGTERVNTHVGDFEKLEVKIDFFEYEVSSEGNEKFSLKEISFEGNKGELIGIVGLSGSGKSTLLKILSTQIITPHCQIRLVHKGREDIFYKGTHQGLPIYKEYVSLVSQDSHIFSDTVKFNITMGEDEGFDDFWQYMNESLPYLKVWGIKKNDSIDVKKISLGQKQLLSALRSCFIRKSIVLFDEISSGMDSELELALRKMVLLIQKYSLTIIVAHRLETIKEADKILVLDQGKKVAIGAHEELLKSSELYRELTDKLLSAQEFSSKRI